MTEAGEATSRYEAGNGRIAWLDEPGRLLASYRLTPDGSERIARRLADRYLVGSFRPDRFSRRIWVDRENGFLLRDLAIDASGRVVEERRYELIEFGVGAPDPGFGVALEDGEGSSGLRPVTFERLAAKLRFAMFAPQILPEGFAATPLDVRWSGEPAGPVHLIYGDGLARVELWQRQAPHGQPAGGGPLVVRRRIAGGTTRLALVRGETAIDVTSTNLDAALLSRIVASLRREGES